MKRLKTYIHNFLSRAGSYVFVAVVLARGLSFIASWSALQLVPNKELGVVLFAFSMIQFLIPIGGFGLNQGLIRYGALLKEKTDKNDLFVYVFKRGLQISFVLVALIILGSFFFSFEFEKTNFYLAILSFTIIPTYLFEIIRTQFRLQHNNKLFAYTEVIYSFVLLFTILLFSYFFKEIGYITALITTPLISSLFFIRKLEISFKTAKTPVIANISFWKYGFFSSLANVATQLLFIIDFLLIGYLLKNAEMVTIYKYLTLIPFSLQFLPRIFISTDFVSFTEKIYNKTYIYNYIKSYMLLFSIISFFMLGISWGFSSQILSIFGEQFLEYSETFLILMIGISGIFIFRGLFGNLLSSLGKAYINYYIVSLALLLNILSNLYLIPKYGIKGAAITSATLMWFTGICSFLWFFKLYKKEKLTTF